MSFSLAFMRDVAKTKGTYLNTIKTQRQIRMLSANYLYMTYLFQVDYGSLWKGELMIQSRNVNHFQNSIHQYWLHVKINVRLDLFETI